METPHSRLKVPPSSHHPLSLPTAHTAELSKSSVAQSKSKVCAFCCLITTLRLVLGKSKVPTRDHKAIHSHKAISRSWFVGFTRFSPSNLAPQCVRPIFNTMKYRKKLPDAYTDCFMLLMDKFIWDELISTFSSPSTPRHSVPSSGGISVFHHEGKMWPPLKSFHNNPQNMVWNLE